MDTFWMEHLKSKQQNKNKQGRLHKKLTNKQRALHSKDTSNRMKRHSMEWEKKIFVSPLSDKKLISKMYKKLI